MKNLKRILAVFLTAAFLATSLMSVAVFADEDTAGEAEAVVTEEQVESGGTFSDVSSKEKYATAVNVLNKLGVIGGYEDGTFKPMNNVTRAEFSAMLLRALGMGQAVTPTSPSFPDVPTDFWGAGVIEAAKSLNIIGGYEDGTFRPNNNVSYEEALTMIVRAIGYENYSPITDVWYSTYVTTAQRLGITKNAVGNVGLPATRSCIAQFIYDTLEVKTRENDTISEKTVMEEYLGLIKDEGIIASNGYTSLDSPDVNLKDNEIKIRNKRTGISEVFRVDNIDEYSDILGETITYYYKDNTSTGYKDVVFYTIKSTTSSVTVDAGSIEPDESDSATLAYYKTESASTTTGLKLDSDNVVIYNGKLYGNTAAQSSFGIDMIPVIGSIKLVNTDSDSDYDILFIDSYEIYAVSSVTSSTYTVTDKVTVSTGKTIVLDPTDDDQIINFTNTNGDKLSFSSISKNKTICVKESNDNNGTKMYTVIIVSNQVSGEVKAISSSGCTVGTKTYKYSDAAPWKNGAGDLAEPEKGSSYTFFLDMNGDIVAHTKDATAAASSSYGYIMSYAKEKSGLEESPVILYILTQSGTKVRIPMYKNTKINGTKIGEDYGRAIDMLEETAEYQSRANDDGSARQLIKYTTRVSDGTTVLDTIVTVTDETSNDTSGGDAVSDTLRMYGSITSENSATYTSSSKVFKSGGNSIYLGSAVIFVIPEKMADTDGYRKGSSSDFKNGKPYKIEAFDISTTKNAKVIVLYGGSGVTEVDYTTPVFRIESVADEYNDDKEESMLKVNGYENGSETEVSYWVSSDSKELVEALDEGDFVRFGTDGDGYVTLDSEDILYEVGETEPFYVTDDETYRGNTAKTYANTDMKVILGSIYSTDDGTVIITPEFLEDGDDPANNPDDETQVMRITASRFSSAKFYKYDTSGNKLKVTKISDDYASIIDGFITYDEDLKNATTKVLVHVKEGTVKTVIVIE